MTNLNLQTIIKFDFYEKSKVLQLKDGAFALYSKGLLILFDNNLLSKRITFYDDNDDDYYYFQRDIKSVKQLKNGKILCCNKHLFIINSDIKSQKDKLKKIRITNTKNNEKFLDVAELDNGTIIGITTESLYNIKIKDENSELTQIHKIPEEWLVSWEEKYCYDGELNIYDLKNNKILLHSHSYYYSRRCLNCSAIIKKESKIFIVDLNNFEVVYTENFPNIANIVVLKDCICVYHSNIIFIYSINDYKMLQKIESELKLINKYNDNIIIAINKIGVITLYNLSDLNTIKCQNFICKFFKRYFYRSDISICKLDNRRIIIVAWDELFLVELPDKFSFEPISLIKKSNIETNVQNNKENKNKKKKYS